MLIRAPTTPEVYWRAPRPRRRWACACSEEDSGGSTCAWTDEGSIASSGLLAFPVLDDEEACTPVASGLLSSSPRAKCLADAMWGECTLDAAVEAWGARLRIDNDEVAVGQQSLGVGCTAQVFEGTWGRRAVAVKRLEADEKRTPFFIRELGVMASMRHPNLVRLFGFCSGADVPHVDLVLELCRGGNLFELLYLSDVEMTYGQQLKIAGDTAEAMAYLHGLRPPVMHRDLKSLNVLLAEPVLSGGDVPLAKIADFGLAKVWFPAAPESLPGRRRGGSSPASKVAGTAATAAADGGFEGFEGGGAHMTGRVGTVEWSAPELLAERGDYCLKVDVYAFGMLLYELAMFEPPFADCPPGEVKEAVLAGGRPQIDREALPAPLALLMEACWAQEPDLRPSFSQVALELGPELEALAKPASPSWPDYY